VAENVLDESGTLGVDAIPCRMGVIHDTTPAEEHLDRCAGAGEHLEGVDPAIQATAPIAGDIKGVDRSLGPESGDDTVFRLGDVLEVATVCMRVGLIQSYIRDDRFKRT
jgi:hypothetical protein